MSNNERPFAAIKVGIIHEIQMGYFTKAEKSMAALWLPKQKSETPEKSFEK